jgi:hypothetical protein
MRRGWLLPKVRGCSEASDVKGRRVYPQVIQFETKQRELDAELGLYAAREALAQPRLAQARASSNQRRGGVAARLRDFVKGEAATDPKMAELRRIPLFAALPQNRFELLERTTDIVEVPAGIDLIREGTVGREFFAIAEGAVEVSKEGKPIATGRAGDVFGELALLHGVPRTATVKSTSPTRLFVLSTEAFQDVVAPSFKRTLAA